MLKYIVKVVDQDFIKERWSEIESLITSVFKCSNFNDKFTSERPLWHIQEGLNGSLGTGIKHVIALSSEDIILGAAFCIPTHRNEGETSCDLGWFFVSNTISHVGRIRVTDGIGNKVYEELKKAGFNKIITEMGTEAGAKLMQKRHGYVHEPQGEKTNRWVKIL